MLFEFRPNLMHVTIEIHQDDLSGEQTKALLGLHLAGMNANSPPGHVFGVGAALLDRVIAEARARGMRRLSLETGSGPAFEPALKLYRKRGFVDGEAFADYVRSDFNQFLHLSL
jgi:putative acetyltransferase